MASRPSRQRVLARRVGWLDRHRRRLAIAMTAILTPLVMWRLAAWLGSDWPRLHLYMIAVIVVFGVWMMIEVGLVWLTASWETEHDALTRDAGLPRAVLRRKR